MFVEINSNQINPALPHVQSLRSYITLINLRRVFPVLGNRPNTTMHGIYVSINIYHSRLQAKMVGLCGRVSGSTVDHSPCIWPTGTRPVCMGGCALSTPPRSASSSRVQIRSESTRSQTLKRYSGDTAGEQASKPVPARGAYRLEVHIIRGTYWICDKARGIYICIFVCQSHV